MNRKIILLLSSLLLTTNLLQGQCGFIRADKFDNIWTIHGSQVLCFDKQHKKIGTYSNLLLGNPTTIDPLDPFRVMVFYPNPQVVIILNNSVAEISKPIQLKDKGINDATLVCRSSKGGFWVFDRTLWQILHFDSGFNPTGEKDIPDMSFSSSIPLFMQEYQGILYVSFKSKAICRFDSYGARMGDIPVKVENEFTFWEGNLIYQFEGKIFSYNLESNQIANLGESVGCVPAKVKDLFLYFDGSRLAVHKLY